MAQDPHIKLDDHSVGLLDVEQEADDRVVLAPGGDEDGEVDPRAFRRLAAGMGTFLAAIVATYLVPGLGWAQPWPAQSNYVPFWNLIGREFMGEGAEATAAEEELSEFEALARAEGETAGTSDTATGPAPIPTLVDTDVFPPYQAHPDDERGVKKSLENAEVLDAFYQSLTLTELGRPGAVTRVSHWGDSVLGNDGITGDARLRMQARFGDAGHGFHALTKYDASYRHRGVRVEYATEWKRCYIIYKCAEDGRYGFGGSRVRSPGGAKTVFQTTKKGPMGMAFSRAELWYMAQPGGGKIEIKVDQDPPEVVDTRADAPEDRWALVQMDDGPHTISVRATGGGPTQAYGMTLERDGPGVVWDGLALIGAFTSRFLYQDPEHLAAQFAHRDMDLMVFTFGGNDLQGFSATRYRETFDQLLTLARQSDPDAACLVTSVIDHGERKGGRIVSAQGIERMVKLQRELAIEHGCAFLDLWTAMGGQGSMGRWSRASPKLGSADLHHLTPSGHKVIGGMIYRALMEGYRDYRGRMEGKPLPDAASDPAPAPVE